MEKNNEKNNEKKIYLHAFEEKVQDGPVKFLITAAEYSVVESKKTHEKFNVVKVTVEVQELDSDGDEKELKTVNIFEDFKPRSFFHQFVAAALEAVQTTAFTPAMLIGLKGTAKLSHFKPDNSEFSYPQLTDWKFYAPSKKVEEALQEYVDDTLEDELEDFDFEYD